MRIKEKKEVKAIHAKDLDDLLKKSGQLEDFENKKINCIICNDVISKDNIGRVKITTQKLQFTCKKSECFTKMEIDNE